VARPLVVDPDDLAAGYGAISERDVLLQTGPPALAWL
jgi:hypothetical protein